MVNRVLNGQFLRIGLFGLAVLMGIYFTSQARAQEQTSPIGQAKVKDLRELADPTEICNRMPTQSDRKACAETINQFDHFDAGAADACMTFSFSQDRLACLRNIGGKVYDDRTLEMCRRESMTSNRLQCLAQTGRPFDQMVTNPNCLPLSEVARDLETSITRIDAGETARARAILANLLHQARVCQ